MSAGSVGHVSTLAGAFPPDSPGLPRGRGRIDDEAVRSAQRRRLLRAAISAFADLGFAATTITDITTRARVSRAAFYAQFDNKEDCFIAAVQAGRSAIEATLIAPDAQAWSERFPDTLRAAVREYLRVSAAEPEFTRAWTLELPNAGPAAARLRNEYFDRLANTLRTAHAAHMTASGHAPMPAATYLALIGGCHELFYRYVLAGRASDLQALERPMLDFLTASLT